MKPTCRIIVDDVLRGLSQLPDESIHCVVTSPPYWNLRDYNNAGQIGLEKTPEEFIAKLVEVFREVKRVLRNDGTIWVNLGDCHSSQIGKRKVDDKVGWKQETNSGSWSRPSRSIQGGKPKNLVGIPWRVAFALQADGWYLRTEIIWEKPSPMPESCRDRPTRSHEYIFLLSKRPKYFYDMEAVKEPVSLNAHVRGKGLNPKSKPLLNKNLAQSNDRGGRMVRSQNFVPGSKQNDSFSAAVVGLVTKRNKRTVWKVATKGYKGAHFATYPPKLILPCILAGTSAHGCCSQCGAPYKRILAKGKSDLAHQRLCGGDTNGNYNGQATKEFALNGVQNASDVKRRILAGMVEKITVGWEKTCHKGCDGAGIVPCTVLDPFAGSGTTLAVSFEHGRSSIGIEINPEYAELIRQRMSQVTPLLKLA